jgi:hypothetical protein
MSLNSSSFLAMPLCAGNMWRPYRLDLPITLVVNSAGEKAWAPCHSSETPSRRPEQVHHLIVIILRLLLGI